MRLFGSPNVSSVISPWNSPRQSPVHTGFGRRLQLTKQEHSDSNGFPSEALNSIGVFPNIHLPEKPTVHSPKLSIELRISALSRSTNRSRIGIVITSPVMGSVPFRTLFDGFRTMIPGSNGGSTTRRNPNEFRIRLKNAVTCAGSGTKSGSAEISKWAYCSIASNHNPMPHQRIDAAHYSGALKSSVFVPIRAVLRQPPIPSDHCPLITIHWTLRTPN